MPQLIAQGEEARQRWRRRIPEDRPVIVGRGEVAFSTPWDDHISRRHAELTWREGLLNVVRLDSARNPVFFHGEPREGFTMEPGDHFAIGQTTFTLVDQPVQVTVRPDQPDVEQTFSPEYLKDLQFRHARARLDVLSRLPDVIAGAGSDEELCVRMVSMLIVGIPTADAVALLRQEQESDDVQVLHWDGRAAEGSFEPSARLIGAAVDRGESVLHIWGGSANQQQSFTEREDVDWAFCTPLSGDTSAGWSIYVTGRLASQSESGGSSDPDDLRDDLKFTEVAAAVLRSLRQQRALQRRQAIQDQFFSPTVLRTLSQVESPDEALRPRETEVTVMFCDLRGFTRESEASAGDLMKLLDRVSRALGVTTRAILDNGGVVGDFLGDAVLGFWGWPVDDPDRVEDVCNAALAVRAALEDAAAQSEVTGGFGLGIGIATGAAVAGKIGTADQVKVTVFGPVVNLASRLEKMTKTLGVPILLDQTTAQSLRDWMPRDIARLRRVAVVRPEGMSAAVQLSELLPPARQSELSDEALRAYEAALDVFVAGDWEDALARLDDVPRTDRAKDFLIGTIARHNRIAPLDWDGALTL